ncbi:alpha-L-fucosidase [bacterium]|nr:alpha-L-fucosidase [bacterium]
MKRIISLVITAVYLCAASLPSAAQTYMPAWESLDSRPVPAWFQDAKFGIFIHWGVYSVPAWRPVASARYASYAEWYYARVMGDTVHGGALFHKENYGESFEYRDFASLFRAELFDPGFWAELFAKAGAKYVVLTSKHHDGFCLWPTESPFKKGWNAGDTGPRRDLVGDLAAAVRAKGLRMGLYYSLPEWESTPTSRTPSGWFIDPAMVEKYRIPRERYVEEHVIPQLKELVTRYQPAVIFSDGGEWDFDEQYWRTKEFLAWLYNDAPNRDEVVVNDRWAKGIPMHHGDYYSSEYKDAGGVGDEHPWEESRGIGGSYGFNRAERLDDYSTSEELIHELIDIVSRGGNLLLNVGPTADGRIPVIMQERLRDIGDWLKVNGEAIYATRSCPGLAAGEPDRWYTRKGSDLYVICGRWPEGEVAVPGLRLRGTGSVTLLGSDKRPAWRAAADGLYITPPPLSPAEAPCAHAFVFKLADAWK